MNMYNRKVFDFAGKDFETGVVVDGIYNKIKHCLYNDIDVSFKNVEIFGIAYMPFQPIIYLDADTDKFICSIGTGVDSNNGVTSLSIEISTDDEMTLAVVQYPG